MEDRKAHDSEIWTIAALATPPAPAGVAVIRISGPATRRALRALFRAKKDPISHARLLILGDIIDFKTQQVIDKALAFFMPGPHSFTGEDVAELQFHGSPLLVQKILRSLYAFGISPAEPGEFTKRAFINGKLDLVQAEAIADLINATSDQALKIAGEHLQGRFSSAILDIGEPLRDVLAQLEATIDFPEEDIEPEALDSLSKEVQGVHDQLDKLLQSYAYGQVVKEGFRVLLCGRPNAGKSSILNALLGKSRAIVTDVSGTTRDILEEEMNLGGYRFIFCDSAGIRESDDTVEKIGIELAKEKVPWADLVMLIVDATDVDHEYKEVLEYLRGRAKNIWMVTNKIDLNPQAIGTFYCDSSTCQQNFYLSARTRAGFDGLVSALCDEVGSNLSYSSDSGVIVTSERHRLCLERAREALKNFRDAMKLGHPPEILAAELRLGLSALEEIIGKTITEDILGRIFSKFCIGK